MRVSYKAMILVVQCRLPPAGKAKNLASVQSVRLNVFSSPYLVLEFQRICRELLSSVCVRIWKKILTTAKECLIIRIDELASKSENKQAKSKGFLLPCPFI